MRICLIVTILLLKTTVYLQEYQLGETCLDYLLWHIPTHCALGIVFFCPREKKNHTYSDFALTAHTSFIFPFLNFFFSDKRKIIVGLPNMKTIITVEHQDINQTLGLHNLYGSISKQNFNLAFSKDRRRVVAKDFSW